MSRQTSKKQILIDFFAAGGKHALELADLHAARDELRRHLGPANKTSIAYVAATLRQAGYEVRYEDRYSDPLMPEPYSTRLKGALEFRDLASAEQSLLRLDAIYREYASVTDRAGVNWVRTLVKKGKLRAQSVAGNARVQEAKRQEKREIARWFQVWLETPDLFADWINLRKSSEDYRQLFGTGNPRE